MKRIIPLFTSLAVALAASSSPAADRPELHAFPFQTPVTAPGTFAATGVGENFVLSGPIVGDVSITGDSLYRVTLSDAVLSGTLSLSGDAQLWLVGDNTISASAPSAVSATNALAIGGPGTLSASAPGGKKTGVVSAADLVLAGGHTALTIASPAAKNACGVSLSGNYTQLAGTLSVVGDSPDVKQNGLFLSGKKTSAAISGGTLSVSLAGEKSIGLAVDKASSSASLSGGVLRFAMSGDGSKGVKTDGDFSMSGGLLDATLSGGCALDYYVGETTNDAGKAVECSYVVTLTASSATSGGSISYPTSKLLDPGTYPVLDPANSCAVKGGTVSISGGTVRIRASGTAARGIGADSLDISGGVFDIAVSGGPSDVAVEMLDPDALTTCLDSSSAACLKTSGTNSVLAITGGTFNLAATGDAGKLISADGHLVIGVSGATTLPSDDSFSPDIQGSTSGARVWRTSLKQNVYGSLATASATTDIDSLPLSVAANHLVKSSTGGFNPGGPAEDPDYANPKGVKAISSLAVHSGRLRVATANEGGEGIESKANLAITGGLLEFVCADDCINTAGDLSIDGGWLYCASTGNDGIDSNGAITINDGVILAFTTTTPECGIDLDNPTDFRINGGIVVSFGASTQMAHGSTGAQASYLATSRSAAAYAGKYLVLPPGATTVYAKIPSMASPSGTLSLLCSNNGWNTVQSPYTAPDPPDGGDTAFHGLYIRP